MSPETTTTQANPSEITVPEGLLPAQTETSHDEPASEMISVPEGLIPDTGERGIEAGEVHNSVSVDLAQKAIAEAKILRQNQEFEQASITAVESARIANKNANIQE